VFWGWSWRSLNILTAQEFNECGNHSQCKPYYVISLATWQSQTTTSIPFVIHTYHKESSHGKVMDGGALSWQLISLLFQRIWVRTLAQQPAALRRCCSYRKLRYRSWCSI
jgi:hypothetical protein